MKFVRVSIAMTARFLLLVAIAIASTQEVHSDSTQSKPKVLVSGAAVRGANGITTDAEERLYVASVSGQEIVVMDSGSGKILNRFGLDSGVQSPDDAVVGPDGAIFWTGLFSGQVGRIDPDGTNTIIAEVGPGPNPITLSPDGRLFMATAVFADALYELDPTGVNPPQLILENVGGLNAFAFGPDGLLYAPVRTTREVVRIDVDTGQVELVATDFAIASAAKFDSQGILHVSEGLTGKIFQVDPESGAKTEIADLGPGVDNIAFDSQDRLFAANIFDGSVVEALPNGHPRVVSPGGLAVPSGVAILPDDMGKDEVFVADFFSLKSFDGQSGLSNSFTEFSLDDTGLTAPSSVSADGDNLLLTSWFFNAVQIWDPVDGQSVQQFFDFNVPVNAIRFQGDLVVAEFGTGSIVRASGTDPASRTTLASGLTAPSGLASTDDDLWAVDFGAGTVLQIVADGQPLSAPTVVAAGLVQPEGLAVDVDGSLLVVESGTGRLLRVDPATGATDLVADGLATGLAPLPNTPPSGFFSDVTVGLSGKIYITGDHDGNLYRIQ